MTDYVLSYVVNYQSIEGELLAKCKHIEDYNERDVETMCDLLYKHQLATAFGCPEAASVSLYEQGETSTSSPVVETFVSKIQDVFDTILRCEDFHDAVVRWREEFFFCKMDFPSREEWVRSGEKEEEYDEAFPLSEIEGQDPAIFEKNSTSMVVYTLLSRQLFWKTHELIVEILTTGQVSKTSIQLLYELFGGMICPKKAV